MSMPWTGDFWSRIGAGVNPITALTTSAPKSAGAMSSTAYDVASPQRAADARAGLAGAPGGGMPAVAPAPAPAPSLGGGIGGGGGAAPTPQVDPAMRSDVANRIAMLQHAYSTLFGTVDANVADQKATYDQGFTTAQGNLGKNFDHTTGEISMNMAGRGLGDSSYLGDAQGQARDTFNTANDSLIQGRDAAYTSLGKFAATEKAQLGAGRDAISKIDLSQYTDPAQLMSLRDQIDAQIASVSQTSAGLGTNASYKAGLLAAAPAATDTGSAALQKQLDTLSKSSASPMTKNTIAAGLIKAAGVSDPNQSQYWADYFQKLGGGGVAQPAV